MPIQVLDQNTINQIAAGEVVERPASVVKELMENAIDAGATAVTVEIREGGIAFIRITDNGCGIENVRSFRWHFCAIPPARSGRQRILLTVSSLGFRGEALSSIAAVSQVELITKTARQPDRLPVPDRGRTGKEPGGDRSAGRHHLSCPEPVLQYPGPTEVFKDRRPRRGPMWQIWWRRSPCPIRRSPSSLSTITRISSIPRATIT